VNIYSVPFALQRKPSKKRIEESEALYVKWQEGTEGGEETSLNSFLIKVLYKDGWSTPQPDRFTTVNETRSTSTHCTGNWVGPMVRLNEFGGQKTSSTHQVSNPE
jgi:hypothetical protein